MKSMRGSIRMDVHDGAEFAHGTQRSEDPRNTLSDWIITSAGWPEPLYERLHRRLLTKGYVQTDETTFPLRQTGRTHPARARV